MPLPPPKSVLLSALRVALLAFIALCAHRQHRLALAQGLQPLTVAEVRGFLPTSARLVPDSGPRAGWGIEDAERRRIGYAARTAPRADDIRGYSGPTDTLMVFDAADRLLGLALRHSYDTPSHVEDVRKDVYFLDHWKGMTWQEIAALDPKNGGVEGVSGATRTSVCLARGLVRRTSPPSVVSEEPWSFARGDAVLLLALAGGLYFSFARHRPGTPRLRRAFQIAVFLGVGLLGGDLLAQSLLVGWTRHGVAWKTTPGLACFALAAFLVPLATRKPMYCSHICPHGAAQEWLGRRVPARFKWQPPEGLAWGLSLLPGVLLLAVVLTTLLGLSFDLAGLEPFDAYAFQSAGLATLIVAGVSLLVSAFVPMAYCRFGCPTGALLKFIRAHGAADRFSLRDAFACAVALLAWVLTRQAERINLWIVESPWW